MDTNELFVAILVTAIALGVLVGVITSHIAVNRLHQEARYNLASREDDISDRNQLLRDQAAIQRNRDNELRIREETVRAAEAALAQRTAQAVAALYATNQAFQDDTLISDLDWEKMPELRDGLDDTVQMPKVEEEL